MHAWIPMVIKQVNNRVDIMPPTEITPVTIPDVRIVEALHRTGKVHGQGKKLLGIFEAWHLTDIHFSFRGNWMSNFPEIQSITYLTLMNQAHCHNLNRTKSIRVIKSSDPSTLPEIKEMRNVIRTLSFVKIKTMVAKHESKSSFDSFVFVSWKLDFLQRYSIWI